ncbi:MAG: putative Kdp system regulatory protein KdpQ [Methanonatronarchaeales archaeon]|nr:putative Kdp system regulatory protein KdpQ [Methanonatronarchaeales archaeon]
MPTWSVLGELGEIGIIQAAGQFVPYGVPLLLIAGLTATMSALNATVYSSSRVSFAMGRDRALPAVFNAIHPVKRTPHWAILFSALVIVAMAVLLPIESVAAAADIMFILLFVQVNWTVVKMRQTHPDLPRTFRIPLMPWPPLVGLVLQFILTPFLIYELGLEAIGLGHGNEGLVALLATVVWMVGGTVIYYAYSRQQEEAKIEEEMPRVVTEHPVEKKRYRILVPVANRENLEALMDTALDVARDRDGEVMVLNVVTVPQQTPITEGRRFTGEGRKILDEASRLGDAAGVPVGGVIRIGHDPARAILNTTKQYDSDVVLMGWRERSYRTEFVFGSNVDDVVRKARCDVLVQKIEELDEVESILVPTAGGPHAELAGKVVGAIARGHGADVEVVSVIEPGASEGRRESAIERVESAAEHVSTGVNVKEGLVEGRDVVETLVSLSDKNDVTVVGATREGLFQQFLFGSVPEEVGRRSSNTVIMARRSLGVRSWTKRWLNL